MKTQKHNKEFHKVFSYRQRKRANYSHLKWVTYHHHFRVTAPPYNSYKIEVIYTYTEAIFWFWFYIFIFCVEFIFY